MEEDNNHNYIADLAVSYSNRMCNGSDDEQFTKNEIAAAYIIGAEATLQRMYNIIHIAAKAGVISAEQKYKLMAMSAITENTAC